MTDFDFEMLLKKSLANDSDPSELLNAKLKKKLNERKPVSNPFNVLKTVAAAAVIVITTGTVVLNSSPGITSKMSTFPVIGAITDAVTFKNNETPSTDAVPVNEIANNEQQIPALSQEPKIEKRKNIADTPKKEANTDNSYNLMDDIKKSASQDASQSEIAKVSETSIPVEPDNTAPSFGPRMIEPQPECSEGIAVASHTEDTDVWGIEITCDNVTSKGLTLVISQNNRTATGELTTGEYYYIESYNDGLWEETETLVPENEIAWNMIAYKINENDEMKLDVNWEYLYGELDNGKYRIGKNIMNLTAPGDYDECMYYAEFEIN